MKPRASAENPPPAAESRSSSLRVWWRWLPAVVTAVAFCWGWWRSGVPLGELGRYAIFLMVCVTMPGTLVWRALRRRSGGLGEDISAGTAVGFAVLILAYIAAAIAGAPSIFGVIPVLIILVFAALPRLRPYFRQRPAAPTPLAYSWTLAALLIGIVGWLSYRGFGTHPLDAANSAAAYPHVDVPFHLALAGELKNHWPPTLPYVDGQPLHYHWFGHAVMAATSHATGIELQTILLRLFMPIMVTLTVLLTSRLAWWLSGRAWAGPLAVACAFLLGTVNPYGWSQQPAFFEVQGLADWWWESPTQSLGAALFAVVTLHLVEMLRERVGWGDWVLLGGGAAALVGAKGTFGPLLVAGLVAVCLVRWAYWYVARRLGESVRVGATAPLAAGIAIAVLVMAMVVLYRGESDGMVFRPLHNVGRLPVVAETHIGVPDMAMRPWVLIAIAILTLIAWLPRAAGAAGLLPERRYLAPETVFLLGVSATGIAATLAFAHGGFSEYYFLRSVLPAIGVVSAVGFAMLVPRQPGWRCWSVLAGSAVAGALVIVVTRAATRTLPNVDAGRVAVIGQLAAVFVGIGLVIAGLGYAFHRWGQRLGLVGGTSAVMVAMVLGLGLPPLARTIDDFSSELRTRGLRSQIYFTPAAPLPVSARSAARWLRDHSDPREVIATNAHCADGGVPGPTCDNRHFWLSGFSERRVLVEGWGYTAATARDGDAQHFLVRFPDQRLLAENDAVFTAPSPAGIATLRRYGVRWLFVDERLPHSPALGDYAQLRHREGPFAIYSLHQ